MAKNTSSSYLFVFAVLALFAVTMMSEMPVSMAACQVTQLSPCLSAISQNAYPSKACCSRLRTQVPCLCTYARDPNLGKYVTNPSARRVAQICKVAVPKC
ncbi:hypothetical protein MKW94_002369 [Papaver nudicaule]|uniref:Bifunctional inhibitor/plant lipid transfer protein/seed storage helical domain-containing protein n=1 Tax=Papaver nudicaule TaxID=74823 RepID=A0AA41VJD0_PAPNU|nr:hypothetical protein [Papaver nudicaule]